MLTNAMKRDEGDFFCVAENAAGSAEANFTLEILPQPTLQNILDTTQILVIILAIVAILLVSLAVGIFLFLRQRRNRSAKPPEILATSTPVKPPRLNYEINPGSLVANGFKTKGDSTTDNPDLILETNTNGTYQVSWSKLLFAHFFRTFSTKKVALADKATIDYSSFPYTYCQGVPQLESYIHTYFHTIKMLGAEKLQQRNLTNPLTK